MDNIFAFRPTAQGSVTINVTGSSVATPLAAANRPNYVVYNTGTAVVFVEFGGSGVTATIANSYPIGPGMKETLSTDSTAGYIACISGTSGQTLYVSAGHGV